MSVQWWRHESLAVCNTVNHVRWLPVYCKAVDFICFLSHVFLHDVSLSPYIPIIVCLLICLSICLSVCIGFVSLFFVIQRFIVGSNGSKLRLMRENCQDQLSQVFGVPVHLSMFVALKGGERVSSPTVHPFYLFCMCVRACVRS